MESSNRRAMTASTAPSFASDGGGGASTSAPTKTTTTSTTTSTAEALMSAKSGTAAMMKKKKLMTTLLARKLKKRSRTKVPSSSPRSFSAAMMKTRAFLDPNSKASLLRRRRRRAEMLRLFCFGFLFAMGVSLLYVDFGSLTPYDVSTIQNHATLFKNLTLSQALTMQRYAPYLNYHACSIRNHSYTMLETPSLIIAGTQKAGTSAMSALLQKHPFILSSHQGEAHFFDYRYNSVLELVRLRDARADDDATNLDDLKNDLACHLRRQYLSHTRFQNQIISRIRQHYLEEQNNQNRKKGSWLKKRTMTYHPYHSFDKSPSYMLFRQIPGAIRQIVPWTRILVLLRNPVERLLSQYKMHLKLRVRFNQTLARDEDSCKDLLSGSGSDKRTECLLDILSLELDRIVESFRRDKRTSAANARKEAMMALDLRQTSIKEILGRGAGGRISSSSRKEYSGDILLDDGHAFCESSRECFLQRGMYAVQLSYWLEHFDLSETPVSDSISNSGDTQDGGRSTKKKGSIMVLPYEVFKSYPQQVYNYVLKFLDLPPHELDDQTLNAHYGDSKAADTVGQSTEKDGDEEQYSTIRNFLQDFYSPYNERLVDLLGEGWRGIWDDDDRDGDSQWKEQWLKKLQ